MNISEIRYRNARYLAELVGGISAVADKLGKGQPQISHLLADKPVKNIGNKIAREFEKAFNKSENWLDHPHPELWCESLNEQCSDTEQNELSPEALEFARLWQTLSLEQRAVLINTARAFIHSRQK